jgi:hypothetical protein
VKGHGRQWVISNAIELQGIGRSLEKRLQTHDEGRFQGIAGTIPRPKPKMRFLAIAYTRLP